VLENILWAKVDATALFVVHLAIATLQLELEPARIDLTVATVSVVWSRSEDGWSSVEVRRVKRGGDWSGSLYRRLLILEGGGAHLAFRSVSSPSRCCSWFLWMTRRSLSTREGAAIAGTSSGLAVAAG
jgi:hypothetical protein